MRGRERLGESASMALEGPGDSKFGAETGKNMVELEMLYDILLRANRRSRELDAQGGV